MPPFVPFQLDERRLLGQSQSKSDIFSQSNAPNSPHRQKSHSHNRQLSATACSLLPLTESDHLSRISTIDQDAIHQSSQNVGQSNSVFGRYPHYQKETNDPSNCHAQKPGPAPIATVVVTPTFNLAIRFTKNSSSAGCKSAKANA